MSDFIPIEIVERLSKQGLTEMEIVSQLKLRGFREDQINSAVNEAIKQGVVGKPGVPARPYVDANEQNLDIPRHPENALQPPAPSSRRIEDSAPLSQPPENIKIPEDLKPMELEEIGFPTTQKRPAQPSFIEEAPIQPTAPKPIEQVQPSRPSPLPQTVQQPIRQNPTPQPLQQHTQPQLQQPTRHPIQQPIRQQQIQTSNIQNQEPPEPTPIQIKKHPTPKPIPAPIPIKQKHHRRDDITLEELVEEVVAGETEKIDKKITNILNKNTKTTDNMTLIGKKITKLAKLTENKISDTDNKINEVSSRIISMENRISALEEAFKSLGAVMNRTTPSRFSQPAHKPIHKTHRPIKKR
jgi:hypothetical protein